MLDRGDRPRVDPADPHRHVRFKRAVSRRSQRPSWPGYSIRTTGVHVSEVVLREVVDGDLEDFFTHQQDPEADRTAAFTEDPAESGTATPRSATQQG